MPIAIITIAHTNRCCIKKRCVSSKKATIPTVIVAHTTRNPKKDSGDDRKWANRRTRSPPRCHAVCGGRCSYNCQDD